MSDAKTRTAPVSSNSNRTASRSSSANEGSVDGAHDIDHLPALGFISMVFMRNTGELLATHRKLIARAAEWRYQLEKVYVQNAGPPDAIFDMLGSLTESAGVPLVVPTLHHLAAIGPPTQIRNHLRHCGHEVLIANKLAERTC